MERLIPVIESHCTFPLLEKRKLFRRVLFCFLTGNEDMHLKNFSLIGRNNKIELSPAYDLLNSTISMGTATEELALPINGKKRKIRVKGRHDPCIVPRVVPVVEAMAAIVLLDSILIKKAYATV